MGGYDPESEWARVGAFFLLPAMQAAATLLHSCSTRQHKPVPPVQQLVLSTLPAPFHPRALARGFQGCGPKPLCASWPQFRQFSGR